MPNSPASESAQSQKSEAESAAAGKSSTSPGEQADSTSSLEKDAEKLKWTPDWATWGTRPTISLRNAIRLLHNIHTSRDAFERLKRDKKETRPKNFQTHLNTLISNLPYESLLPTVHPLEGKATGDTEIWTADFVAWIEHQKLFDKSKFPPELKALKPNRPSNKLSPSRPSANVSLPGQAETSASEDGVVTSARFNGKAGKTLARILLALAIKHHKYRPRGSSQQSPEASAGFAEIKRLCNDLGFEGLNDWTTVKSALEQAANALNPEEVAQVMKKR